jgi:hypothetical protein
VIRLKSYAITTRRNKLTLNVIASLLGISFAAALWAQSPGDQLPMNQIQVVGSHNSYKRPIDPALFKILMQRDPKAAIPLEYSHVPYNEQLDLGMRKLEIDVVYDPKGGLYANPLGLKIELDAGVTNVPAYDPDGEMRKPGFKVIHVPDVDFRSQTYTFKESLRQLREWSDAHPGHLPIAVTMNAKDTGIDYPNAIRPLLFDAAAFDAWDAEIREILPPEKLLTPDDVRGGFPTLEAAVLAHAWPALAKARGRFLFVLDETGEKLETYVKGHPSLHSRVMFVNATEGRPEAAFRIINEPIEKFYYIQKLVRDGYIVRTRADADTFEARKDDYTRMEAAFASGAQYISTDYYRPNPDFHTRYRVQLPGGRPGRWNPVLFPPLKDLPPPE